MGQRIAISDTRSVEDSIIVTTDRSLTGTEGEGFDSLDEAGAGTTFPAKLAVELFEADAGIARVYISQNVVVVTRSEGWGSDVRATTERVIEEFFLFYP